LASEYIALAIAAVLLATVLVALFSKKVSISLIALFYSSIILGVAFTVYGDALVGLLTMVTFAGAISVLLLSVILITGESRLDIGGGASSLGLTALTIAVAVASVYVLMNGLAGAPTSTFSDLSTSVMTFAWQFRPWDLLILVTVFASAMLGVANLLSRSQ
jgi:NADH:ubiquinone oxidoreductase subunit 6 (subunit J)